MFEKKSHSLYALTLTSLSDTLLCTYTERVYTERESTVTLVCTSEAVVRTQYCCLCTLCVLHVTYFLYITQYEQYSAVCTLYCIYRERVVYIQMSTAVCVYTRYILPIYMLSVWVCWMLFLCSHHTQRGTLIVGNRRIIPFH